MIKVNICIPMNMLVAFACVRTSIMYKCFKFGISSRNARNVKSQQRECVQGALRDVHVYSSCVCTGGPVPEGLVTTIDKTL